MCVWICQTREQGGEENPENAKALRCEQEITKDLRPKATTVDYPQTTYPHPRMTDFLAKALRQAPSPHHKYLPTMGPHARRSY